MNKRERAILNAVLGGRSPRLAVRSNTRIDAGSWWRRTPLWVCLTDNDVLVLAASRRQYFHKIPIANCQGSHYCHTTGELVLHTDDDLQFSRFAMPPTEGLRLLEALGIANTNNLQARE